MGVTTALESTAVAPTRVLLPSLAFPALATAGGSIIRPIGHGVESSHRGMGFELKSPVKGTQLNPHPIPLPKLHRSLSSSALVTTGAGGLGGDHGGWRGGTGYHEPRPPWETNHSGNKIPKMNFPKFMAKILGYGSLCVRTT